MKKIVVFPLIAFLPIFIASFIYRPSAKAVSAENATVFIYRVGQFGAAANNWAVFADGQKICKLSNNKFIKHEVAPGKHVYTAKIGGPVLLKKETGVEIDAEAGKSYYIACNVKTSITRARLELLEVTKSSGEKQMAKMSLDNCQEKIDANQ